MDASITRTPAHVFLYAGAQIFNYLLEEKTSQKKIVAQKAAASLSPTHRTALDYHANFPTFINP